MLQPPKRGQHWDYSPRADLQVLSFERGVDSPSQSHRKATER